MKQKSFKTAYRREYRRQFDHQGQALNPPAETRQEGDTLVMVIDGVRYIGRQNKQRAFCWVPESGEG